MFRQDARKPNDNSNNLCWSDVTFFLFLNEGILRHCLSVGFIFCMISGLSLLVPTLCLINGVASFN